MLKDWINPRYLDEREIVKIRNNFLKSKPYPNFALSSFLNENKLSKLKKKLSKETYGKIEKDLFSLSHTKDLSSSNNSMIKEFYSLLSSREFISMMEKMTGEALSGKINMQSHSMTAGDYLLPPDDVVEGRCLAYIFYLSDLNMDDGGALRLYDAGKPLNPVRNIYPRFNSFACFKVSEKSLHDVEEVISRKQRLTIGGWFYGE